VLLAACSSGGGGAAAPTTTAGAAYDTVEDLHAALERGGAGCRKERTQHDAVPGVDALTCRSTGPGGDGSTYVLLVRHADAWPKETSALGTDVAPRVEGANWYVLVLTGDAAQPPRIQAALGGTIQKP
jgi:hypothetical protein